MMEELRQQARMHTFLASGDVAVGAHVKDSQKRPCRNWPFNVANVLRPYASCTVFRESAHAELRVVFVGLLPLFRHAWRASTRKVGSS